MCTAKAKLFQASGYHNKVEKLGMVEAIPFCGEYPGPRFEDKFRSAIKWMEFEKLAEIKWLPVNL